MKSSMNYLLAGTVSFEIFLIHAAFLSFCKPVCKQYSAIKTLCPVVINLSVLLLTMKLKKNLQLNMTVFRYKYLSLLEKVRPHLCFI
jgi:hypothetical protein